MYTAGMVPRGDVLRVKVSFSQAEQDMISAKGDMDVRLTALERAAGVKFEREGIFFERVDIEAIQPPNYEIYGDLVETALEQRPETTAYGYYMDRVYQLIRSAKGERHPTVTFSGNTRIAENNLYAEDDVWQLRLDLQWAFYDGGERASQVKKIESSAKELSYHIENLNSRIRQEVIQALQRLNSAKARYEISVNQAEDAK